MATFNRDNYLVKSNPDFVWTDANKATFEDMELFLKMGKFFYLESHAGNGKNELIKKLAEKYNRPLVLISCAGDMGTSSLLGRITALPDGTLGWQDGLVAEAMINGCILVLDEINALDSTVTFAMHNLPDGYINIANNNRMIKAHPDFFLIGTCNPMGYEGVKAMNEAWQGRLACVKMRYDSEVDKMIMDRCPKMPVEVKTGMLAMINMIRDNTDNGQISKPFGHRTTSQIVDYVNGGIGLMKAWDYAYLNKLSDYDCAKVKRIMQDFTSIMEFANGETAKVNDARI